MMQQSKEWSDTASCFLMFNKNISTMLEDGEHTLSVCRLRRFFFSRDQESVFIDLESMYNCTTSARL